jgi:hypothetical protein
MTSEYALYPREFTSYDPRLILGFIRLGLLYFGLSNRFICKLFAPKLSNNPISKLYTHRTMKLSFYFFDKIDRIAG